MTAQLFDDESSSVDFAPAGRVDYWRSVAEFEQSPGLMGSLERELDWRQLPVRLFGKSIPQPRLTAFYADPGISYRYSGLTLHGQAWTPDLALIRALVERYSGFAFNSVLCNLYRDGDDYMGWHADDEPELGLQPAIASVSFGAARRFVFKPKSGAKERREFLLAAGSLLVMSGDLQEHWLHQLPKARKIEEARINLTLRQIKPPGSP